MIMNGNENINQGQQAVPTQQPDQSMFNFVNPVEERFPQVDPNAQQAVQQPVEQQQPQVQQPMQQSQEENARFAEMRRQNEAYQAQLNAAKQQEEVMRNFAASVGLTPEQLVAQMQAEAMQAQQQRQQQNPNQQIDPTIAEMQRELAAIRAERETKVVEDSFNQRVSVLPSVEGHDEQVMSNFFNTLEQEMLDAGIANPMAEFAKMPQSAVEMMYRGYIQQTKGQQIAMQQAQQLMQQQNAVPVNTGIGNGGYANPAQTNAEAQIEAYVQNLRNG